MNSYKILKSLFKGKKAVSVRHSIVGSIVRHYETDIVEVVYPHAAIPTVKLSSGGHFSVTTKRHINNALSALGVNASVYQRDYTWYVNDNGNEQVFFDGYIVNIW